MFLPAIPVMHHFNSASARVRYFLPEIFGSTVSGGGAVTAWQEQTQWTISVLAGLVGLIAGLLTIRSLIKKERALS